MYGDNLSSKKGLNILRKFEFIDCYLIHIQYGLNILKITITGFSKCFHKIYKITSPIIEQRIRLKIYYHIMSLMIMQENNALNFHNT